MMVLTVSEGLVSTSPSPSISTTRPTLPSEEKVLLGSATCLLGNLLISISLNLQKQAHNNIAGTTTSYIRTPIWWTGILLMSVGEVANFAAYGFAPTGLIATLGSSGVIFNFVIAYLFLKEKPRGRDIVGTLLAVVGAGLLVYFAKAHTGLVSAEKLCYYLKQTSFLVFFAFEVILFGFIMYLRMGKDMDHIVFICIQVALLGSVTVLSAKAVASLVETSILGHNQFSQPILYVAFVIMVASIFGQIRYLNEAMSLYDSSTVIPINFVFFSLSAVVTGITFYEELWYSSKLQVGMTTLGVLLSSLGVFLISGGRSKSKNDDEEGDESDGDGEDEANFNTSELTEPLMGSD